MTLSTRAVSSLSPASPARRRGAARVVVSEGFASVLERIEAAAPPAAVSSGPAPVVVSATPPGDRAVLAQFVADLAAAPVIVGELVALYVEQHPRLAIWFAARAARARADAPEQIEAAARWREVCGAAALAELIRAALAIACPSAEPEPAPPPVILDLDADFDDFDFSAL
jgi:hypothetical protein